MFRSIHNLTGALRKSLKGRQRHDFVDDLESFFWVYAWIAAVYDGPGEVGQVADTEHDATFWQTSTSVTLSRHWKQLYLNKFDDLGFKDMVTPFFSQPVYSNLLQELRSMMCTYNARRLVREKDANGVPVEVDFFPEMEVIYAKVLGYFDDAIFALPPPPPKEAIQQAKRPRDEEPKSPVESSDSKRVRLSGRLSNEQNSQ